MARGYYGVPGTGSDFGDEDYYYEYEPILTTKDARQQDEESGIGPANIILFLMGLPFLPLWTALAVIGHSIRIGLTKDPDMRSQLETELKGFWILLIIGVIMYMLVVPRVMGFWYNTY